MGSLVTPCDRGQGHLPRERHTARENHIFLPRAGNKHKIAIGGVSVTWFWATQKYSYFLSVFPLVHTFSGIYTVSNYTFRPIVTAASTSQCLNVPRVSHGSFFQEQMSSPVRRMAWSWCRPCLPPRVDCQWQKLFSVWSAWWLITKPSCEIKQIKGGRKRDNIVFMKGSCEHRVVWI